MTPEERAEKILIIADCGRVESIDRASLIAAQIAEAEREARISQSDADHSEAYDEGFAAAKAKAAVVVKRFTEKDSAQQKLILAQIERMEP